MSMLHDTLKKSPQISFFFRPRLEVIIFYVYLQPHLTKGF